jgi:hypothetical protein
METISEIKSISEAIQYLVPGAQYLIWEDGRIVWNDKRPMPSEKEIEDARPMVEGLVQVNTQRSQLADLETTMYAYIESRYSTAWRMYLLGVYAHPKCSEERKAAIESVLAWIESVVQHYSAAEAETDWAAMFDASDPGVTLLSFPE